ncbi:S-layer homology domain-containing protein [Anaerotignum sp.]|uniref:S-layer homology domain-containing protein n=1 Tax=Anaerotignum sp. TaxID=2039241 RepID=UPI0028AEE0F0|nr:S-layer homology domain-containing protein [Anaerotignum sp.]
MNQTKRKLLSAALAMVMTVQTAMPAVFAVESEEPAAKTITGFTALAQTDYTLPLGADEDTISQVLTFPETITAEVEYITTEEVVVDSDENEGEAEQPPAPSEDEDTSEDEQAEAPTDSEAVTSEGDTAAEDEVADKAPTSLPLGLSSVTDSGEPADTEADAPTTTLVEKVVSEQVELAITWESDSALTTDVAGEFVYTAVLSGTDKGKYDLADGVSLPQITVYVEAAPPMLLNAGARAPEFDGASDIYANGTAIKIVAGTTTDYTNVLYDIDGDDTIGDNEYLQIGDVPPTAAGYNLSKYTIYGGAKETEVASTSVTMNGGTVFGVYGGGMDSGATVTGDTKVEISGGTVANVYGGGLVGTVTGSTTVNISGATVESYVYGGGYFGKVERNTSVTISDTATIATGVFGNGSEENATVGGTKNGYVALANNANIGGFDNIFYTRDATNWTVQGSYTIEGDFTIAQDAFLSIMQDSTLTMDGTLINNGTVNISGTLTMNGTLINNDTVNIIEGSTLNGSGQITGNGTVTGTHTLKMAPTMNVNGIFANGTPITIEAGTAGNTTAVWYGDANNKQYVNENKAAGDDLSQVYIFGGAYDTAVASTSITMTGGTVIAVIGGGMDSGATVTGNTTVNISGGTVKDVYGGGWNSGATVTDSTTVNMTGGTVDYVYGGGQDGAVEKNTTVNISGGTVITVYGYGRESGATVGETKNGYVALAGKANADSFTNLLHKTNATSWVSKGSAVIPEGETLTVGSGDTLTLNGTLTAVTGNNQLVNNGGTLKTTHLTAADILGISDKVYTGNIITLTPTVATTTNILGKDFTVDSSGYTSDYQKQNTGGSWVSASEIKEAGAYQIVYTKGATTVEKQFNVAQSATEFTGGVKAYKGDTEATTFTYGDTITVKVTPTLTGTAPTAFALTEPTADEMALYVGNTQITDAMPATNGAEVSFTIDTAGKHLISGENTIIAKYVGNDNMASAEGSVTVTLNPKAITSATVVAGVTKVYDGTNNFTNVGLTLNNDVLDGDTVTATASGTVDNKNVGAGKAFTATSVVLSGTDADYYSLAANAVSGSLEVTKLLLVVSGGKVADKVWDGTADAPVTEITFHNLPTGDTLRLGTDYKVVDAQYLKTGDTGEQPDSDAGYNKYVGFGTIVPQNTEAMNNFTLNETLFSYLSIQGNILKLNNVPAPTFSAMDDAKGTDTFTFTPVAGFTDVTAYEYSMDGGTTWTDVSANPIPVGNVAGVIKVRVKETTNYEAGAIYSHNVAFTASLEGSVSIDKTTGVTYGDTLTATASGTQSGAVLSYKWLAGTTELQSGSSNTLQVPGAAVGKIITVEVTAEGYTGKLTSAITAAVDKANAPAAKSGTLMISNKYAKDYSFDLATLLTDGKNFGTATYTVKTGTATNYYDEVTNSNIANDKLNLSVKSVDSTTEEAVGTITVTVQSQNYKDMDAVITVKSINKIIPVVTISGSYGYTYGQTLSAKTLSGSAKDGTTAVAGTFAWIAPETKLTVTTVLADWIFIPSDTAKYAEVTGTQAITVAKATPSGTPSFNKITSSGKTLADANLAVGTITPDGSIAWDLPTDTAVTQGTAYAWTFTPTDSGNYNNLTGKVTLWANSSGGGSGGGSSSGDNTTVTTPPATTENPKPATEATITVKPTVANGTATVTVSESVVNNAIAKAQAEAKKNGKTENGINITIKTDTSNASSLTASLPKAAIDALVKAGVKETSIQSGVINITHNLDALKEIQKQAGADVTVTATKVANSTLSAQAKTVIGNRPVYDLSITGKNGVKVTDFGSGKVSVSIPYTLGADEKAANVIAYYIDSNGKVEEMPNSAYDTQAKTLSFVTDHFSLYGVGYKANETTAFTDITNHWAKESIEFVAARGLLSGTGNNKFSPDTSMTRGMFVTALGRLAGAEVSGYTTSSFTDVKAGSYYLGYIEWASKNGIVNGTGNGKFAPDQSISREQMAVIMQSYAKAIGFELPKAHAEILFADHGKISSYATDAVKTMQMAGILAGKNGNKFDPQGTATRAEVSAVLKRFVELVISTDNAQGWMQNDSGKWMFFENGRPVTGTKTIDGTSYTFDVNGETADMPKNLTYSTYTVQKGDSFWSIAWKYKCNLFELARVNDKSIFSMLYVGDVLKVPSKEQ